MSQRKPDYVDGADINADLDQLPDDETVETTVRNFETSGFDVAVVDTTNEAFKAVQSYIPADVSAMNGYSTTLEEIGSDDYLSKGNYEWGSLSDQIWGVGDDVERRAARRDSQTTDYFLGGTNAIAQTGELVAMDPSRSYIGAYPFAISNVVIVSGINKIVPTLGDALDRLESVTYPLKSECAEETYGTESVITKQLIFRQKAEEDRTTVVLIREQLGY